MYSLSDYNLGSYELDRGSSLLEQSRPLLRPRVFRARESIAVEQEIDLLSYRAKREESKPYDELDKKAKEARKIFQNMPPKDISLVFKELFRPNYN
ncbi:MAG: hypothetical protein AABY10_01090 [Nanoarchaeota archaeon]